MKTILALTIALTICFAARAEEAKPQEPVVAPTEHLDALAADEVPSPEVDHTDEGLEIFALEGEGKGVYLGQRFQHTLSVVRLPDGRLAIACVAAHPHNVDIDALRKAQPAKPVLAVK